MKKEKLSNNHKLHQIYLSPVTGIAYPGGSTIAGLLDKGFGMVASAVKLTRAGYDYKKIWDEKRDAGTLLHAMLESHISGKEKPDLSTYTQAMITRAENSMLKYYEWEKENKLTDIKCETQVISEQMRAGGTVDLIAKLNGQTILGDFKSGGLYDSAFVQTSGYAMICEEMGIHIDKILLLHLPQTEDDKFQARYLTTAEDLYYSKIFKNLCEIYWWKNEIKNLKEVK